MYWEILTWGQFQEVYWEILAQGQYKGMYWEILPEGQYQEVQGSFLTANQPTTAAVPENPVTKKGRDWLLSDFLFGTGRYPTHTKSS